MRKKLDINVFDAAIERMRAVYREGHRVIVSFSAGKDSGVCLELSIMAAQLEDRLPVEVVIRDEEVMFPGTYEYAERVAARPEVKMHWLIAGQPIINLFNRELPYFWVFDQTIPPEQWVRQPPAMAEWIPDLNIQRLTHPSRFPPPEGKKLMIVIGLRGQESQRRLMGIHASQGYIIKYPIEGQWHVRPIYDWLDGDVWLAHQRFGWDYNHAYDVMAKLGVPRAQLRIAPPTMSPAGANYLHLAAQAWPEWFDRVAARLPGVRTVAQFGKRAVMPTRHYGETWEQAYQRLCIDEAPGWIADRARYVKQAYISRHAGHSTTPIPESEGCAPCGSGKIVSWKKLTEIMYNGDPFKLKLDILKYVEPEFFRPGSGTWGGKPTW